MSPLTERKLMYWCKFFFHHFSTCQSSSSSNSSSSGNVTRKAFWSYV